MEWHGMAWQARGCLQQTDEGPRRGRHLTNTLSGAPAPTSAPAASPNRRSSACSTCSSRGRERREGVPAGSKQEAVRVWGHRRTMERQNVKAMRQRPPLHSDLPCVCGWSAKFSTERRLEPSHPRERTAAKEDALQGPLVQPLASLHFPQQQLHIRAHLVLQEHACVNGADLERCSLQRAERRCPGRNKAAWLQLELRRADDSCPAALPAPTHLPVPALSLVLPYCDDRKVAVGALALQGAGVM